MLLAIYDLSGIQSFLFSSNKMREISGASRIVHEALFTLIPQLLGVSEDSWKTEAPVRLEPGKQARIVYIGGGNALVLYADSETCRTCTRELQKRIFLLSGGGIRLCSAVCTLDEAASLAENQKRLMAALDGVKKRGGNASAAPAFPVTAFDNSNYEPLIEVEDGTVASAARYAKLRPLRDTGYTDLDADFAALRPEYLYFQTDMESTREEDGRNYEAVIHIDGNTMGVRIREFVDGLAADGSDLFTQMGKLRDLSVNISRLYQDTVRGALERVYPPKEKPYSAPFRPVVADGDDVTVIIAAKDAFRFVKAFMELLSGGTIREFGAGFRPTAAAGIAFAGLKFPFSVAYDMAEACCKNAKAVTIERRGGAEAFRRDPVSSFDYQIIYSNIPDHLREYREKNAAFVRDGRKYTLMRRPYQFCADSPCSADDFLALSERLKEASSDRNAQIARSKLKGFRNAYGSGVGEAERYAAYIRAHAKQKSELEISEFLSEPFNEEGEAKFFDVLDVMDLLWKEETT